jgi:hypothetical protein
MATTGRGQLSSVWSVRSFWTQMSACCRQISSAARPALCTSTSTNIMLAQTQSSSPAAAARTAHPHVSTAAGPGAEEAALRLQSRPHQRAAWALQAQASQQHSKQQQPSRLLA